MAHVTYKHVIILWNSEITTLTYTYYTKLMHNQ